MHAPYACRIAAQYDEGQHVIVHPAREGRPMSQSSWPIARRAATGRDPDANRMNEADCGLVYPLVVTGRSQVQHSNPAAAAHDGAADAALRALYEAHGAALLSYLIRLTNGDRHRAEDLLQETLVRAWRHPGARVDGSWSRPWLFMVAKHLFIDHVRAVMARPTEIGDERLHERWATDDRIERVGEQAQIRAGVLDLPPRFRDVLIEIYFRDRSVAKTAEILGVPEGTVKSRTFYALRALRERFTDGGPLADPDVPRRS
jgi:RNA polymerase sigma-70 factor (ECF subfamily)